MRGRTRPVMGWCILFALGMASGCLAIPGLAQWSPKKNVEIVAMSGPGGANDIIARTVQGIIQQKKLVEAPVTVVSKVGAGGVLAWSQAQIAYWEDVLAKLVQTEEWKKGMNNNFWESNFMTSAESRKFLQAQYDEYKAILADIGLAR